MGVILRGREEEKEEEEEEDEEREVFLNGREANRIELTILAKVPRLGQYPSGRFGIYPNMGYRISFTL